MTNPKISICIPAYNRPQYLKEAIASILAQSFSDFELIISDDCSPIDLSPTVSEFKDDRIKFFRQKDNLGFIKNWNFCLLACRGEYIKIMGDDDILLENCLADQFVVLEKNKNVGLVYSNLVIIDGSGAVVQDESFKKEYYRLFSGDRIIAGEKIKKMFFLGKLRMGLPSAALFRKDLLDKVGVFDENIGCPADIDMWLRILDIFDFGYTDKFAIKARIHRDNLSKKLNLDPLAYKNNLKVLYKHKKTIKDFNVAEKVYIFKVYFYQIRKNLNYTVFRLKIMDTLNLFIFLFL